VQYRWQCSRPPLHVQTPEMWTQLASTCAPDEASARRYDTHVGDFKHKGLSVGTIVTRCNVTLPHFGPGSHRRLEVRYRDQDGHGLDQQVRVMLTQYDQNGLQRVVAEADSSRVLFYLVSIRRCRYLTTTI
jgi:hypothetical protein